MKGVFFKGLREAVRKEIKLHPVDTLSDSMEVVQLIDEKSSGVLKLRD